MPRGGGARGGAPGTGVCGVLTDVHRPGLVVEVGTPGRSVKRRVRGVWRGFPRPQAVVGAGACKRQHMGTVVGHRGTGVPVGPRRTLTKGGLFHALPLQRLRIAPWEPIREVSPSPRRVGGRGVARGGQACSGPPAGAVGVLPG